MITTPKQYQKDGVRAIHARFDGRSLVADDMGLGKSFEALYYKWKYLDGVEPGPVVVVCPAHLKLNWKKEVTTHLGERAIILEREKVPADYSPTGHRDQVYIINYDILEQSRKDGVARDQERSWWYFLRELKPKLVIGDEAHYIKNPAAGRSKAFRRMVKRVPHLLLLTGTPMTNKPPDLWNLVNLLCPDEYPSRFDFNTRYTNARHTPWGWDFKGARNLDELHQRLRETCMVRRLKSEVMAELPAKTRSVLPIEVDLREYRKAEMDFLGWLRANDAPAADRAARSEELTKMGHLKRLAGRLKIKAVTSWVSDFLESGNKLLLGAIHHKMTHPIVAEFKKRAVLVDGDLSDRQKQVAFDRFNHNPDCDLCVANLTAGGTGWSCKATSDVAICEFPWNPGDALQFEDRIHGLARGRPGVAANIYYLYAVGTIEEDICRVLETKQGWLGAVLDGGVAMDGLDLYEQVRTRLKEKAERAHADRRPAGRASRPVPTAR